MRCYPMFKFFSVLMDESAAAATNADGTQAKSAGIMGYLPTILMIVAMVAIFYFLLYRPQKKQERETTQMRNSLEVGDEITTIGGIIGEVVSIKGETVTIETGKERSKIRILRSAVKSIDVKAGDDGNSEEA